MKTHAWYADNSSKTTHVVGQKEPNQWGLYDMYGNVAEWCNDVYGENYYKTSPSKNPRGPEKGEIKVFAAEDGKTAWAVFAPPGVPARTPAL